MYPAKPLAMHKLEGTYRHDRHGKTSAAAKTARGIPAMPRGLDSNAKALWRLVVAERGDWLSQSDGPALTALCETWGLRCRALKALADDATDKDARISYCNYQATFERLGAKFGMTPSDRAAMGEVVEDPYDVAAEFVS